MGLQLEVQEVTVMLGVYSDQDHDFGRDPTVLVGVCEGVAHVPGLISEMKACMDARAGVRDRMEYFWSASTTTHVRSEGGGD